MDITTAAENRANSTTSVAADEQTVEKSATGSAREATQIEIERCRHVAGPLRAPVWVALTVGALERFAFYSISTPWQNYLQNARNDPARPGVLGLGQSTATNIFNAYLLFAAVAPTPFAIISDTKLGRFKTLAVALSFYALGSLVMLLTSTPPAMDHGAAGAGIAVAMVFIGLGVGGVKATINVFIGDQCENATPTASCTKNGEIVVVDRSLTLQYVYNVFYWMTNISGLAQIPATFLERYCGFWTAYLLGAAALWATLALLLLYRNSFVRIPASGNVLPKAGKVLWCATRNGFKLDRASPQYQLEHSHRNVPWNEAFLSQIRTGLIACKILAAYVIFYLCFNQMSNNLVSQAGQMELAGTPNDMIQVFNAVACIILGPVIQKGLYPTLAKYKIPFKPVARITAAFLIMSIAMAYAAGIQKLIYSRGPCHDHPLACPKSNSGRLPNAIIVWVQLPVYFILAVGEIFGFVTALEYSYSKAPKDMKAMIQAFAQLMAGIGAALGMAVSPAARDPHLVKFYAALAAVMAGTAVVFWFLFHGYDRIDDDLDAQQALNDRIEDDEER